MKNKFLKAWGSILLLSVAFVISTRWTSVEVTKALELLTYSAFLITIPILVIYVIAHAVDRSRRLEEMEVLHEEMP